MDWEKEGKFRKRKYKNYKSYIQHQQSKLTGSMNMQWLKTYDNDYHLSLYMRLCDLELPLRGKSVLCLGARIGTEVRAFIDNGCFAVGIDVNPGPSNQLVVSGDFHELVYADSSVDIVFTNSIDHCLDIIKIVKESKRVLRNGGYMIIEELGKSGKGPFESFAYDDFNDVLDVFYNNGFKLVHRKEFGQRKQGGDKGTLIVLQVKKDIVKDYDLCL